MSDKADDKAEAAVERLIGVLRENEKAALDAVRDFVNTVDGAFPSLGEDGPRRRIIDAAFRMTEQLVDTSNQAALNIVQLTTNALEGVERQGSGDAD